MLIIRKMVEKKVFLAYPKRQYMDPNEEDMIVMPITKRMEFITSIQVFLISWMNSDYNEIGGRKNFSSTSNKENMIVVLITKRMEIITSIHVYLISRMNINYKENGVKKSLSSKSKASISCITMWRT